VVSRTTEKKKKNRTSVGGLSIGKSAGEEKVYGRGAPGLVREKNRVRCVFRLRKNGRERGGESRGEGHTYQNFTGHTARGGGKEVETLFEIWKRKYLTTSD